MAQSASGAATGNAPQTLSYSAHWNKADSPSVLARFSSWTGRFLAASNSASQAQMLAEGIALAKERSTAFAVLLKSDPGEAIASTVPAAVRARLPAEILNELETRVSGLGDYSVRMADPYKGGPAVETLRRVARLNGNTYRAQVYGRRLGETTKHGIPLHGVALDGVLALDQGTVRQLEPEEKPDPARTAADLRSESEKTKSDASSVLGEMGGKLYRFGSVEQLRQAEGRLEEAEAGIGPNLKETAETVIKESAASLQANGAAMPRDAATSWTAGGKSLLVIRVDFSDLPGDPHDREGLAIYTADYCQTLADTQISPYYRQSSYGLTTLSNTVTTQLYRMPQPAAYYLTNSANDQLHLDAETAAGADYAVGNFDRIIVLFSPLGNSDVVEMSYGGLSTVGGRDVWANGEFDFRVVAHELGHTYGLYHANLWEVSDGNPISSGGVNQEYGDEFDTMGANFSNDRRTDFNPWFKNLLGWIPDAQVQTITASGLYRVNRFDDSSEAGTLALKVARDNTCDYWIGVRHNFADNASLENGAYIIWGYDYNRQSDLLDLTTPGVNELDAALGVGASLKDPACQITINPVNEGITATNDYLDVQIILPPVFTRQPTDQSQMMGRSVNFIVAATGDPAPVYQWQRLPNQGGGWMNLPDGGSYSGTATPILEVSAVSLVMNGDQFRCLVSNGYATVGSSPALLYVNVFNLTGSGDQAVTDGQSATFSVVAGTHPVPSFQWQRQPGGTTNWSSLIDNGIYNGSKTAKLQVSNVVSAMNGDHFQCAACIPSGCVISEAMLLRLTGDSSLLVSTLNQQGSFGSEEGSYHFGAPAGVTVDGSGNIFIANTLYSLIQRVTSNGVSTVAGSLYQPGASNGVGANACFNSPAGLTVDPKGNLFVADTGNHAIRKITPEGRVSTFAGRLEFPGSRDGQGTNAFFDGPTGVAADSAGNVFVADTVNSTIRKITPDGQVRTIAGQARTHGSADGVGGNARFNSPAGLAVDGEGNVFVADTLNNTIRKIIPDGTVRTLAGQPPPVLAGCAGGPLSSASFSHPSGIAVDGMGNLYIADTLNSTIRKISPAGAVITVGGVPKARSLVDGTNSLFSLPASLAADSAGNLFIADTGNGVLRQGITWNGQPIITTQPQSISLTKNASTATFSVVATGNGRLTYQWQKDGVDLHGATQMYLGLNGVSHLVPGAYSVTVSNAFGLTLSESAVLRLPTPQQLEPPVRLAQGLAQLSFRDPSGTVAALYYAQSYFKVQASTNLLNWQTLSGQFSSSNGFLVFTEQQVQKPRPLRRFYRILGE